jgi:hypothetical protein
MKINYSKKEDELMTATAENLLTECICEDVVRIKFKKVDGDVRKMICTLNFAFIPEDKHPLKYDNIPRVGNDTLKVFDLEIQDWRSFHFSNILEWKA